MKPIDGSTIEAEFVLASQKRSEAMRNGDPKLANRYFDKIHRLKNQLRLLPDRGEAVLKKILLLDNPELRISASAALLAVDEAFAKKVLTEIAAQGHGLLSSHAQLTIQEWENGNLRDYLA